MDDLKSYFSRKTAEDYVKGRQSRISSDSGSGPRSSSRVSFTDAPPVRQRGRVPSGQSAWTEDPDEDDVPLSRYGVRCDTATPSIAASKPPAKKPVKKQKPENEPTMERKKDLSSVMASYLRS